MEQKSRFSKSSYSYYNIVTNTSQIPLKAALKLQIPETLRDGTFDFGGRAGICFHDKDIFSLFLK